jgi:hypothetical protein
LLAKHTTSHERIMLSLPAAIESVSFAARKAALASSLLKKGYLQQADDEQHSRTRQIYFTVVRVALSADSTLI